MVTTTQNISPNVTGATAVDAIEFVQSGYRMYLTCLTAEQLISTTIVDPYDSRLEAGDPDQGYQRPPERSRITPDRHLLDQRSPRRRRWHLPDCCASSRA